MPQEHINKENQFEALFNHATIGIIVSDNQGMIVNINDYAMRQFGFTAEELKGKSVDLLVPQKSQHAHQHYRDGFYRHPSPRRMGEGRDLFAQRKDGSTFPVEISLSNYSFNGQMFVIAFVIDITVRKKQESVVHEQKAELERVTSEIKTLNAQLEQKVEARTNMLKETLTELEKSKEELNDALKNEKELGELKSRFVTMASHEFRTPLSTILTSAYLLEKYNEHDKDEKIQKHIDRTKGAVAGMKSILEDFLSLGKLEEGLVAANPEYITAPDCLKEITAVVQDIEPIAKPGQQIQLTTSGSGSLYLDKHLLKNILVNLLSNAIKFSPENTVIAVIANISDQYMELSVADHGIGISEEDQQQLFDRFFRARNAVNIQGTGLGLHIIAKYLELMHGSIEVRSRLNEGTTFTISIPGMK